MTGLYLFLGITVLYLWSMGWFFFSAWIGEKTNEVFGFSVLLIVGMALPISVAVAVFV